MFVNKLNMLFLLELNIYDVRLILKGLDFCDLFEIVKVFGFFIIVGVVLLNDLCDFVGWVFGKMLEEWFEEIYKWFVGQDVEKINLIVFMQELKESIEDIKMF